MARGSNLSQTSWKPGNSSNGNRALRVETPQQSLEMLRGVLDNRPGAARDIVLLNAGVALYAADVARSMADGIERAGEVLASGAARDKLRQFVACTGTVS